MPRQKVTYNNKVDDEKVADENTDSNPGASDQQVERLLATHIAQVWELHFFEHVCQGLRAIRGVFLLPRAGEYGALDIFFESICELIARRRIKARRRAASRRAATRALVRRTSLTLGRASRADGGEGERRDEEKRHVGWMCADL